MTTWLTGRRRVAGENRDTAGQGGSSGVLDLRPAAKTSLAGRADAGAFGKCPQARVFNF